MDQLDFLYIKEIVRMHSLQNPCFTSRFWHSLQKDLGIELSFNIVFHPQTNSQSNRVIQVRTCALNLKGNWDNYLTLMEFAYCQPKDSPNCVLMITNHGSVTNWFEL